MGMADPSIHDSGMSENRRTHYRLSWITACFSKSEGWNRKNRRILRQISFKEGKIAGVVSANSAYRCQMEKMLFMRRACLSFMFGVMVSFMLAANASAQEREIAVKVEKKDGVLIIDAEFSVPAGVAECWAVLTDFDNMERFIEGMQSSQVTKRSGNALEVVQKGRSSYGLISFAYESIRQVTLVPQQEIRSHGIGGSVKKYEGVTRLIGEGNATRIVYHAESVPGFAVPSMLAISFTRGATQRQFNDLRAEILRRKMTAPR
jgi:carbon monoxide dehydrogenase subunit G